MAVVGNEEKGSVCFLGPRDSFTHQAAQKLFPRTKWSFIPVSSIPDLFKTIQTSSLQNARKHGEPAPPLVALLPFENNTNGPVLPSLACFADTSYCNVRVVGEVDLRIDHYLLVPSSRAHSHSVCPPPTSVSTDGHSSGGKDSEALRELRSLTHIYSHPQVWSQCTRFLARLRAQSPNVQLVDVASTAAAAELVAQSGGNRSISRRTMSSCASSSTTAAAMTNNADVACPVSHKIAAIASRAAAAHYNLQILRTCSDSSNSGTDGRLNDRLDNTTRFLVLAPRPSPSNLLNLQLPCHDTTTAVPTTTASAASVKSLVRFTSDDVAVVEALAVLERRGVVITAVKKIPCGLGVRMEVDVREQGGGTAAIGEDCGNGMKRDEAEVTHTDKSGKYVYFTEFVGLISDNSSNVEKVEMEAELALEDSCAEAQGDGGTVADLIRELKQIADSVAWLGCWRCL